jgi:hypothetical protein
MKNKFDMSAYLAAENFFSHSHGEETREQSQEAWWAFSELTADDKARLFVGDLE